MATITKTTRGRETIPGEGIEQEPSPVHANLLQPPNLDAVLWRQETYGEHFSGWKDSEGTAGPVSYTHLTLPTILRV